MLYQYSNSDRLRVSRKSYTEYTEYNILWVTAEISHLLYKAAALMNSFCCGNPKKQWGCRFFTRWLLNNRLACLSSQLQSIFWSLTLWNRYMLAPFWHTGSPQSQAQPQGFHRALGTKQAKVHIIVFCDSSANQTTKWDVCTCSDFAQKHTWENAGLDSVVTWKYIK